MRKNEILISTGSTIWRSLKKNIRYAKDAMYDGIEIVPSKIIITETHNLIKKYNNCPKQDISLNVIKSLHQSWRLDMGLDKSYEIHFPKNILFSVLRMIFSPEVKKSNEVIKLLSDSLNLPVTVHALSDKWTKDNTGKEFSGGILYEIIGNSIIPEKLKDWMKNEKHNIVVDSRDDQSLLWAKKYGFNTWQSFWGWLGIKKIKCYQLTLIGSRGIKKILKHEKSLAEDQLLWLNQNNWEGTVVVEVNPLLIILLCKGGMRTGLRIINQFVKRTLIEGQKWS